MKENISIYLSVSIKKSKDDIRKSDFFWTTDMEEQLRNKVTSKFIEIYNPATFDIARTDYKKNFVACVDSVKKSDVVLVDARQKKGIGVGAEMMVAYYEKIPVVTIAPINSHYRKEIVKNKNNVEEWFHPFIFCISHSIVENLDEACTVINDMFN